MTKDLFNPLFVSLFASAPFAACFEENDDDPTPDPVNDDPDPVDDDPDPNDDPAAKGKVFTQDDVNRILAEDKRKHKAQLQKAEQNYEKLLKSNQLSQQERTQLEDSLEDIRKQMRTKEEQAKIDKKNLETKLTSQIQELTARAETAEKKYVNSTITRALKDAAVAGDAFNPGQVETILRPMVKMVEDQPMIDFPDISTETGEDIIKQMTPTEAIARMKQLPDQYGNLFKSGVAGGVGASSATGGVTPGSNGQVDIRKIRDMDHYLEIRKNNPGALGLRK